MRLLLARVGVGKTAAVQDHLLELKRRQPLSKVWVLLSTERQIVDFRQRFAAPEPRGEALSNHAFFNVEYFNFYSLYHHLLATAVIPQRCLDDTARYGLIRALLSDLYAEGGGIFGGIAHMPGFVKIIATLIYELKQNLVEPEAFKRIARSPKEVELAHIYAEYQLALRHYNLVDREGEGWLALEALQGAPQIAQSVDLLIIDGYDHFNALQAQLLTVLGSLTRDAVITLTNVPGREATIGRRFADALDRLQAAHQARSIPLDIIPLTARRSERHPVLQHLSDQLLRPKPDRIPVDGAIHWIEAPDPAREIGAVLRRVKRLLLEGLQPGCKPCAPDEILIALRDWQLYGGQVAAQGQIYDLPLALHYGEPLARNPAVVALLDLLVLHVGDFRRRDLLDVFRSPYFAVPGLGADQVDLLERISLELRVTGGRRTWLEALDLAAKPASDARESEVGDGDAPPLLIAPEIADHLRIALTAFFDVLTPPERGTVEQFVIWLEDLIGQDQSDPDEESDLSINPVYNLSMPAQIRRDTSQAVIARDLSAMQQFKHVLRGLLSAQALTGSLGYARLTDWTTFFRDLKTTIDNTTVERGAARDGRVLVTTVTDARGLPHRHVFILGLSEGVFPQPAPEDPLLLDGERQRLRASGIDLPTQAERAGDDGLFYSLIGQARDSLTLSRPHSKNGELWAASHLWRAVLTVFSDATVEHLRLGDVPNDPATPHEAALAAAERLSNGEAPGWVEPLYWARICRARAIELRRRSRDPHDHYSGRLRDADLIAWAADFLSPDRVWSASQLNDYGLCGFRYFAARLLKLEALETPEDGMGSRQLGTLYHEILEQTYRRLGGAITPGRLDEALAVFAQVADERMANAPERLRFRASAQWAQEQNVLRRKLERLIRADFGGDSPLEKPFGAQPREIYRQEAHFEGDEFAIDLGGEYLRVRGSIDRIDRQGERAVVVDYKSGSTPIKAEEIARGRNFQMWVYLLAAQALIEQDQSPDAPRAVAGGLFWHIRSGAGDPVPMDAALIDAGKDHIRRYLELARSGDFAAHANKLDDGRCAAYCDLHQFCRVSGSDRRKQ